MSLFSFDGIVTWIVNPNHFYIQLSTDTDRKCNVEYLIRNLVKNNELENPGFDLQLDLPYSEFDDNQDCVQSPFIDPWANDDDNEEADVEPLLDKVKMYFLWFTNSSKFLPAKYDHDPHHFCSPVIMINKTHKIACEVSKASKNLSNRCMVVY